MSSLFRRKLDELEDMFITSQDDLLARFSSTYEENARLKAEVERLTKAANKVDAAWSVYENGLIETPEWVKRSQVRDAVSRLWNAAKEGKPHA